MTVSCLLKREARLAKKVVIFSNISYSHYITLLLCFLPLLTDKWQSSTSNVWLGSVCFDKGRISENFFSAQYKQRKGGSVQSGDLVQAHPLIYEPKFKHIWTVSYLEKWWRFVTSVVTLAILAYAALLFPFQQLVLFVKMDWVTTVRAWSRFLFTCFL